MNKAKQGILEGINNGGVNVLGGKMHYKALAGHGSSIPSAGIPTQKKVWVLSTRSSQFCTGSHRKLGSEEMMGSGNDRQCCWLLEHTQRVWHPFFYQGSLLENVVSRLEDHEEHKT